jgi:hypothetical protein
MTNSYAKEVPTINSVGGEQKSCIYSQLRLAIYWWRAQDNQAPYLQVLYILAHNWRSHLKYCFADSPPPTVSLLTAAFPTFDLGNLVSENLHPSIKTALAFSTNITLFRIDF